MATDVPPVLTLEEIKVLEAFANQVGSLRSDVTAFLYDKNRVRRPHSALVDLVLKLEREFVAQLNKCQRDASFAEQQTVRVQNAREFLRSLTKRFEDSSG